MPFFGGFDAKSKFGLKKDPSDNLDDIEVTNLDTKNEYGENLKQSDTQVQLYELSSDANKDKAPGTSYNYDKLYPIESYLYYAIIARRDEWNSHKISKLDQKFLSLDPQALEHMERVPQDAVIPPERNSGEMILRMTSFWSVFYLITSDILGPSSAPYAFSTLGYGKGTIIYIVFYGCAVYCGLLIWRQFLDLSSPVHPIRTFADLGYRVWGRPGKLIIMFLHAVYLILAVSQLILGSGQSLSQIIKEKFCFVALMVFWMLFGWVLGQIRSLKNYSRLANMSVYMTIITCILTMAGVVHFPPNYSAAYTQRNATQNQPLEVVSFISGGDMDTQLVGCMQIIYAYAGSMLFPEMLAEMSHPWDFWKGSLLAQTLIFVCYLVYGVFTYCFQGQYVINPANQGVTNYPIQTVCNVLSLVSGMLAAGLYGNIGLKAMYQNIIVDLFKGPPLSSTSGKLWWVFSTILYWSLSFIVAAAVPQLSSVASIAAAACAIQFTYSFPALMSLTLQVQKDALLSDGFFNPETDSCEKRDSWRNFSRWKRGFCKLWYWNIFNLLLGLAALSLAGLGLWSSIESIISTFASDGAPTSFSCKSPV